MPKHYVLFSDGSTMEVAIFKPGVYHNGSAVYTAADVQELIDTYDPATHEAPSVIGHAEERAPGAPAYGWVESLFERDGMLWAKLKNVPAEFKEWIEAGYWKKRSIEIYTNFANSGKKYLRAIAWLGAEPPEVKGLPDVTFSDAGPTEAIEFAEARDGHLRRAYDALRALFAEGDDVTAPITATIERNDAMSMLDRIQWIASDELWRIVYDEEMPGEEKRSALRALFDELKQLIESNGEQLISTFSERGDIMSKDKPAPEGGVTMTPEQLQAHTATAVEAALAKFSEALESKAEAKADAKVKEGLAAIHRQTRLGHIQQFCQNLKRKGLAPALVDSPVLQGLLEQADTEAVHAFGEAAQTQAQALEAWLGLVADAVAAKKAFVPFGETKAVDKPTGDALDAEVAAEFAENEEQYRAMGIDSPDKLKLSYSPIRP